MIVVAVLLQGAASPAYACTTLLDPRPQESAAPGQTPALGFETQDLGRRHVPANTRITYAFCPPTSGDHYSAVGVGPLPARFYLPAEERSPGGWVHNLEHGDVVVLYRGGEGAPSDSELAAMREWFDGAPPPRVAIGCPKKVLVARFDEMSTRFAVLAWDRALLLDAFDVQTALTFADQWLEGPNAPEPDRCP